ncbi:MAG: hypothetical protein WC455_28175 [Dehalococcoidia bacterium]|jgi:uncharacterized coiled-coil DUF342 family protein
MNEVILVALASLVGGVIASIPNIVNMFSQKKKTDADAGSVLVNTAMGLIKELQSRMDAMETDTQKKIEEAACLTIERDELKEEVDELRKEVEALRIEVDELRAENKSLKAALDKRRKPAEKRE